MRLIHKRYLPDYDNGADGGPTILGLTNPNETIWKYNLSYGISAVDMMDTCATDIKYNIHEKLLSNLW